MSGLKVVDMHCDTIGEIYKQWEAGEVCKLGKNPFHLDIEKMKRGNYLLQNFALYINLGKEKNPLNYSLRLLDCFYEAIQPYKEDIGVVTSYAEILQNQAQSRMSALLTIEEGAACAGSPELLRVFYRLGVRMMTLTWNYENEIGFPNYQWAADGSGRAVANVTDGLKEQGIIIVREMERLGMIIDVSHLSDAGFYDVIRYSKKPFVASHSNARAICSHPRNMTDDMIRSLSNRGGVMGLNYYPAFLRDFAPGESIISRISDMVRHIRHITNVGGIGCLGLGSDFDGIVGDLEIADGSDMGLLAEALIKEGFSQSDIEHIYSQNVLNLYKELL